MKFHVTCRCYMMDTERWQTAEEVVQVPDHLTEEEGQAMVKGIVEMHFALAIMNGWKLNLDIRPVAQLSDLIGYN